MEQSFLEAIAKYYHEHREWELSRFTFVFPNQRSSLVFKQIITQLTGNNSELAPSIFITMAELMEKTAGLRRASPNQLLIWLYVAYCTVRKRHPMADGSQAIPEEFDRFRYWGEMLLRDFDEVDRYLVNQHELFKNVRNFKSIQTTYLTPEQLEIIKTYWGEDPYWGHLDQQPAEADDDSTPFWRHITGPEGATGRFAMLWELLGEVYDEFRHILLAHNKCYSGMAFHIAAYKARRGDMADFRSEMPYVFIGFSDLSPSELTVMEELHKRGRAQFFWDYNPELMGPDGASSAGRFVRQYIRRFPQETELHGLYPDKCNVEIVAIPTNTGQAKAAAELLTDKSVLVLPSEDMLLPMLSSLSRKKFPQVSVSMGYPLRLTEVASLFSSVVSMQLRLVTRSDGSVEFFRDDVMAILSHPLIAFNFPAESQAITDYMAENYLFNLPAKAIAGSTFEVLAPIFTPVTDAGNVDQVMDYLDSFTAFAASAIADDPAKILNRKVCQFLQKQTQELRMLIQANPDVTMRRHTFFHLVESAMFRRPVQLTARPGNGLPILGMLETRALCYDHVVILSLCDRVFPGRRFAKSFIPVSLRRGFGMPTPDVAESNMAYNFYRLLSHAGSATLMFDSRMGGLRSGDMSRFLYQLRFMNFKGINVTYKSASLGVIPPPRPQLPSGNASGVQKTAEVMARVNRFRDPDCLRTNALSASALKTYINCPLSFYLEYVADIKVPDLVADDIDSATLGSIFHSVAERMYSLMRDEGKNPIGHDKLMEMMSDPRLSEEIRRAINIHKVHIPEKIADPDDPEKRIENPALSRPLDPQDLMLDKMVREMIKTMVETEPEQFDFIHAEFRMRRQWTPMATVVGPFNFTMSIDRIDAVNNGKLLRFIDYKTGTDNTSFDSVTTLLTATSDKHLGGIFQLLLYCCAYADMTDNHTTPIQPLIYPIKNMFDPLKRVISQSQEAVNDTGKKKIIKTVIEDYRIIEQEFRLALANRIAEIFDPSVPFYRCAGSAEGPCRYCKFRQLCGV